MKYKAFLFFLFVINIFVFFNDFENVLAQEGSGSPDIIAGASVYPNVQSDGLTYTFSGGIENAGDTSTSNGFYNIFQIADALNGGGNIITLSPVFSNALQEYSSVSINSPSYVFSKIGNYSVRICADKNGVGDGGAIEEYNENNNCGGWNNFSVGSANVLVNNQTSGVFMSGESWTFKLTTSPKLANKPVTLCAKQNNNSWSCVLASRLSSNSYSGEIPATTDANGVWTINGSFNSEIYNGTWSEYVKVGDSGGELVSNTVNFTVKSVSDFPDLKADVVWPNNAVVGTPLSFYSLVQNIGNVQTQNGFYNMFQVATGKDGTGTITDLQATSIGVVYPMQTFITNTFAPYTFATSGQYSIRACADKKNSSDVGITKEANENNNCGAWTNIVVKDVKLTLNNKTSGDYYLNDNWTLKLTTSPILANKPTQICAKKATENDYVCVWTNQLSGRSYYVNVPGTTDANGVWTISGNFDWSGDFGNWSQYMKVYDGDTVINSNVINFNLNNGNFLTINNKTSGNFYTEDSWTLKLVTNPKLANKPVTVCARQNNNNLACVPASGLSSSAYLGTVSSTTDSNGVWSLSGTFDSEIYNGVWNEYIKVGDIGSEQTTNEINFVVQSADSLPDLIASGGSFWPTSPSVGVPITFYSTVINGNASVMSDSPFNLFFQVASSTGGAGNVTSLPPVGQDPMNNLEELTRQINSGGHLFSFDTPGIHSFRACVDKTNPSDPGQIRELNENNNCSEWIDINVGNYRFTINDNTQVDFVIGDSWKLKLTTSPVLANKRVQLCANWNNAGWSCSYAENIDNAGVPLPARTDSSGNWSSDTAVFNDPWYVGDWIEYLKIGDIPGSEMLTNQIIFSLREKPSNLAISDIRANGQKGQITVNQGDPVTISWASTNATSCTVSPLGMTGKSGSKSVNINGSTTYTLSCLPQGPSSVDSVLVDVNQPTSSTTITIIKAGQGIVTSVPSGVNCGVGCSTQTVSFPVGTDVKLVASPSQGRIFTGWIISGSNNPCLGKSQSCTFKLDSSKSVIINFAVDPSFKEF